MVVAADLSKDIVKHIAEQLVKSTSRINNQSLFTGLLGQCIFLADCYTCFQKSEFQQSCVDLFERAIDHFSDDEQQNISLGYGLMGLAISGQYLSERKIINWEDVPWINEIDALTERQIQVSANAEDLSLSTGIVGFGVYHLIRGTRNEEVLRKTVEIIANSWNKSIHETNLNTGLSHGLTGIISYLSCLYHRGIERNRIPQLVQEMTYLIISKKNKGLYPTSIESNGEGKFYQRIGWCNGNASVLYGLVRANQVLEKSSIDQEILRLTESIRILIQSNTTDNNICHGASGLYLLFEELYEQTKIEDFKAVSNIYKDQVIRKFDKKTVSGYLGFSEAGPDDIVTENFGFINGASGIGMSLIHSIGLPTILKNILLFKF